MFPDSRYSAPATGDTDRTGSNVADPQHDTQVESVDLQSPATPRVLLPGLATADQTRPTAPSACFSTASSDPSCKSASLASLARQEVFDSIRQAAVEQGSVDTVHVRKLLRMGAYTLRNGTEPQWQQFLVRLFDAMEAIPSTPGESPAVPAAVGAKYSAVHITDIRLHGRDGLDLWEFRFPDREGLLHAFPKGEKQPRDYHERQMGDECTVSTINMLNTRLTDSWEGLSTAPEVAKSLPGPLQTGKFDTVGACSFNNAAGGEGRVPLDVAAAGFDEHGLFSAIDRNYAEISEDVFDTAGAVGLVLLMPNPAKDAVVKSSAHTLMLCRTGPGSYEVRDPRSPVVQTIEAPSMVQAIWQCRRRLGVPENTQQSNTLEIIYPRPVA